MTPSRPSGLSGYPRRFGTIAACLALAGAFAASPQAKAYVYEPGNPSWAAGNVTFVLSLGTPNRTLSDGSTSWDTPAVAAISTWNQYMQSLQLVPVTNDSAPVSDGDGVNSVAFASTFFGLAPYSRLDKQKSES